MECIDTLDIFTSNPFLGIKNAGAYTYNRGWSWKSYVPYAAVYCIVRGKMRLEIAGKQYVAEADDVLFVRSSDAGTVYNSSDEELFYYFISFYYDETTDLKIDTLLHNVGAETLFQKIAQAHRSSAPRSRLQVNYLFLQLIHQLATQSSHRHKKPDIATKLQSAVEYINIHYDQGISVQQLCQITGYSAAHLRRLFVQQLGMSPMEYMQKKRMDAAKELLIDDPERSLEEISRILGICSESYFCKLFKQHTGHTPMAYRHANMPKNA